MLDSIGKRWKKGQNFRSYEQGGSEVWDYWKWMWIAETSSLTDYIVVGLDKRDGNELNGSKLTDTGK